MASVPDVMGQISRPQRVADATASDGEDVLHFIVEGVSCPTCIRKIEQGLAENSDITAARLNFTSHRLEVRGPARRISPEVVISAIEKIGYRAVSFDPGRLALLADGQEKALLRALAVAGFAAANVMLLSVSVWSGLAGDMGAATRGLFHWVSALIALPAIAYAGRPFFGSAWQALKARRLNMDVPISLAVLLAAAVSLLRTVDGGDLIYFDAALMLLFFLLIGRYLDRRLRGQARVVGQNLLALRAISARVIEADGSRRVLPVDILRPGMRVAVAAGERLPADGRIQTGSSALDQSLITGEALPKAVAPGDGVFAGTLNLNGPLEIEVTASDSDSLLAEIVRLMEAAEQRRGRYVRLADRAAGIYAPAVHILAAATFLGWLLLGAGGWEPALMNALAVLIITCPCALGLAVPAVQAVATGRLLRWGILVKAADGLERLATVDHVVFDKTGTLTLGRPVLRQEARADAEDLAMAAGLALQSRHPLARTLADACSEPVVATNVEEVPGAGLEGLVEGRRLRLGSRCWCAVAEDGHETGSGSEIWLRVEGRAPVCFRFDDQIRDDAAMTIGQLRALGLPMEILSGDREGPVSAVANDLGIENWKAGQRPDEKIERLEELRRGGRQVLMVGDGLNDAPALAAAAASISPSSAADISQTAADFVFQGDRLASVVECLQVSRRARRLMLQNFALAFGYNILAVPLAVAGLVTPLIAAVAMSASSVVVTLNALRLARIRRGVPTQRPKVHSKAIGGPAWKPSFF